MLVWTMRHLQLCRGTRYGSTCRSLDHYCLPAAGLCIRRDLLPSEPCRRFSLPEWCSLCNRHAAAPPLATDAMTRREADWRAWLSEEAGGAR